MILFFWCQPSVLSPDVIRGQPVAPGDGSPASPPPVLGATSGAAATCLRLSLGAEAPSPVGGASMYSDLKAGSRKHVVGRKCTVTFPSEL